MNLWETLGIIAQIASYILGIVVIVQIVRILLGGSWSVEDAILALVGINIMLSFGIMGYLIRQNSEIWKIDKIIHGHIQWHKGKEGKE